MRNKLPPAANHQDSLASTSSSGPISALYPSRSGFAPTPIDAMRGHSSSTASSSSSSRDSRPQLQSAGRPPSDESLTNSTPGLTPDSRQEQPFSESDAFLPPRFQATTTDSTSQNSISIRPSSVDQYQTLPGGIVTSMNGVPSAPAPITSVPFGYIEEESAPFTPLTPLDPTHGFPSLPIFDYSSQPTTVDPQNLQETFFSNNFEISRRLSCPTDLVSPNKTFDPLVQTQMPHTAFGTSSFAYQQQQPPLQPRLQSSDWQMQQGNVGQNSYDTARRHSVAPMTALFQQMPFTTPLQPVSSDVSLPQEAAGMYSQGAQVVSGMPGWQTMPTSVPYHDGAASTSSSSWFLNAIAEQSPAGQGSAGDALNNAIGGQAQQSGRASNAAGRRGSAVARKARSQSNLFSPYPIAAFTNRDTSSGSLLDYEGV